MRILEKLQELPKRKKKIILWSIVIVMGIFLLNFYIKNLKLKLKNFSVKEIQAQFQEKLKEMPKIEIPKISEKK